jgi:hypothetical protein
MSQFLEDVAAAAKDVVRAEGGQASVDVMDDRVVVDPVAPNGCRVEIWILPEDDQVVLALGPDSTPYA